MLPSFVGGVLHDCVGVRVRCAVLGPLPPVNPSFFGGVVVVVCWFCGGDSGGETPG